MLKQIFRAFQGKGSTQAGQDLYRDLIAPTRMAQALKICAMPDTFSARFEVLALMAALKLPAQDAPEDAERQLISSLVEDIDVSFREQSLGDATVRKHAKNHAAAFYGRLRAYGAMSDAGAEAILRRNLFGDSPTDAQAFALPQILPGLTKLLGADHG